MESIEEMLIIVFVLALFAGAFVNVCIDRMPHNESIFHHRAYCENCLTFIKLYNMVPFVSYFLLKGKCRDCSMQISMRYPMVELLTAILITVLAWKWNISLIFFFYAVLTLFLIVATFVDLEHLVILDRVVFAVALIGIFYTVYKRMPVEGSHALVDAGLGAVLAGGVFLLVAILSRGGMGGGDIKLIAALGLFFGIKQILLTLVLSILIGAIISAFLLLTKKKSSKDAIPFGPFIAMAAYIVMLYGQEIINIYFHIWS